MPEIKFSNDYNKLPVNWQGTQATLIAVVKVDDIDKLKKDNSEFIKYDATYRAKEEQYPLNFKEGLILVFIHHSTGIPFTTIRRHTPQKKKYYDDLIWKTFNLVLSASKEKKELIT